MYVEKRFVPLWLWLPIGAKNATNDMAIKVSQSAETAEQIKIACPNNPNWVTHPQEEVEDTGEYEPRIFKARKPARGRNRSCGARHPRGDGNDVKFPRKTLVDGNIKLRLNEIPCYSDRN